MNKNKARKIVDDLIADLTDRRGLRQEWEAIDEETQEEIRETWAKIVQEGAKASEIKSSEIKS